MSHQIEFSVIIPALKYNKYLEKNLYSLNKQSFKNFEVIIISENNIIFDKTNFFFAIKVLKQNIYTPGEKRNFAAKHSEGNYLAFIDDDAYADETWLLRAKNKINSIKVENFILGGPGILPDNDSNFSRMIDSSLRSFLYGNTKLRYESINKENVTLDDWPSVNMIIKKKTFFDLKGFDKKYWPGEDSILCNKLIINEGRIIYVHDMIVKHYRRANILKHFKQIFRYSFTRGKLFRQRHKNSINIIYTFPSIFFIYFLICLFIQKLIFFSPFFLIFVILYIESFFFSKENKFIVKIISPLIIYLNILVYGLGFISSFIFFKYNTKLGR